MSNRAVIFLTVLVILSAGICAAAWAGPFCTSTRVGDTTYTYCN